MVAPSFLKGVRARSEQGPAEYRGPPHRCAAAAPPSQPRLRGVERDRAARLAALLEVLLVVVLGRPEPPGRHDLGDDLALEAALILVTRRGGCALLLAVVREDRRPVLAADVPALTVARRRVVTVPERREQLIVGDELRVVLDLHGLRVTGPPAADLLVGRVVDFAAGVADGRAQNAWHRAECGLDAPETAGSERRCVVVHSGSLLVLAFSRSETRSCGERFSALA